MSSSQATGFYEFSSTNLFQIPTRNVVGNFPSFAFRTAMITPQCPNRLASLLAITLVACAANATAADVVIQPKASSSLVVTDAGGTQMRLRVNENGEITMPVLVNGAQQNLPVCVGASGQLGPCAPGAGTGGIGTAYTAGTGLALNGSAFSVAPTYQLPQTCAANQVAQWNGAAWICADGAAGFTLPYTGTTSSPTSAFSVTNSANGDGVVGASTDGVGVRGASNRSYGVFGTSTNAAGVYGLNKGANAFGVGVFGGSDSYDGVYGQTTALAAAGVEGFGGDSSIGVLGKGTAGPGVKGVSDSGYAIVADGAAQQTLSKGGWVKAMVEVQPTVLGIFRCFNSQQPASVSSGTDANNCGFKFSRTGTGASSIDFGFQIYDRFFSATVGQSCYGVCVINVSTDGISTLNIKTYDSGVGGQNLSSFTAADRIYYLIIY